jgi:hypothetical protein
MFLDLVIDMAIRILLLHFGIIFLIVSTSQAQSKRRELYDSLLVGDRITPAVSSVMMPKTYTEIILANSLLTTNTIYTSSGDALNLNGRFTYLINTLQITHGLTSSGRLNVGLDLSYRTGRADADRESSPLKVLGNSSEGLVEYERSLTSIGFRARYVPTRNRNFVIQNTFYVPISSSGGDTGFLGDNRYAFNTQFLYTQLLGRKFFLFGQADFLIRFKDDQNETDYTMPINAYCTYLVNRHFFPFIQLGMVNSWSDVTRQSFSFGGGLQYQFNTMFNINAFYSDAFAGKSSNRWNTYNFGIRVVL